MFDARYAELFADLRRVCLGLGAGSNAEDIAQEALIQGRAKLGDLRDDTKLVPWLRRIAVRGVGRARTAPHAQLIDRSGASEWALVDLAADEREAVKRLPTRQRQMVSLVYFLGYGQDDVADMLEVSRGHVARTLWDARVSLATTLADYRKDGGS